MRAAEGERYNPEVDFAEYARQSEERQELLTGALLIAKDAYPALDLELQARRIDELAAALVGRGLARRNAPEQARALSDHLYSSLGFHGNERDYYDPRNSFLNEVLDRRTGIPISLGVLYIEVARRIGVHASGVSFPGHFLVRVEAAGAGRPAIVDPFFRGSVLGPRELEELHLRATGKSAATSSALEPASTRLVLLRMLANLRGVYSARGDFRALLVVLDRMLELAPHAAPELRDRGLLSAKLGAPGAAIDDLSRYLRVSPNAGDVAEIRRIIGELERSLSASTN
jgi:regulator of sirC expression with transglutaminase-like and TPR domain